MQRRQVGKMPPHFPLHYCCWLILPDVEVFLEVVAQILVSRKINYNSVGVYASTKSSAKATQLNVIGQNNQLFVLDQTRKVGNKLLSIRVMKQREPSPDPLLVDLSLNRIFLRFFAFFLHTHFDPLHDVDFRSTCQVYSYSV